jgi:predicted kinase
MGALVHLLCGRTGSGKTTFARELEREQRAVLLSVDEWMIRLFGHRMERELFDTRLAVCKELAYDLAERIARMGIDVVLDFGFWSRTERDAIRARFSANSTAYAFYFFDVPDDVLKERIARRNANLPSGSYEITEEMFDLFSARFEPPGEDERVTMVAPFGVASRRE